MSDLISVIIPIYNAEKYLDRCVSSIINQTYSNLEIILIEDGSPDACFELCDKWASVDDRIKAIHKKNGGVSAARNAGLDHASGDLILMSDSDDYISPNTIERLYNGLVRFEADLAICDFAKGNEEAYDFSHDESAYSIIDAETALNRIYDSSESALRYVAPWGKLYKRSLFDGIRYPEGKIFEDIYVTHQIMFRCARIVVVNEKLVYYYQRSDSIMNTGFHIGKLDYLQALEERITFFHEHQLDNLEWIAYDEYLHSLIWEYSRARDVLNNRDAMADIVDRFRAVYRKGYASSRYPKENARFLTAFYMNPEWIIAYWKAAGKAKKLFHIR